MPRIHSRSISQMRRRDLLSAAVASAAAAQFGLASPGRTQAVHATPTGGKTFGTLKHIDAGALDVEYAEAGPSNGSPVLLLHGWPYDIHTYVDVAPTLAAAGYRVIVPHLRGYGGTRFLSADTPRNGQQAALAVDAIALLDALKIDSAVIAGCDWGARTANIIAAI